MKINIYESGEVRVESSEKPVLEVGEVLLKIKACGVCGSDVPRVFAKKSYYYPIVLGHEFAGEVVESDDESLLGKRACIFPILPCGECEFCKQEAYANCVNYDYYGSRRNGGMQEYFAVKKENLVFLPDNVSFEQGAMAEPTAVCLHALKKADLKQGESVIVFGAGTIGLLCGMWAKYFGATQVYFVDIDEKKLEMAKSLGFERYKGQTAQVAIEASGAGVCFNQAIENVQAFGRIVLVGNASGDMLIKKDVYSKLLRKQLQVLGSWNSDFSSKSNEWEESLLAISSGKISPEKLITHTFPIAKGKEAFEVIANKEFYNKIMVVENVD